MRKKIRECYEERNKAREPCFREINAQPLCKGCPRKKSLEEYRKVRKALIEEQIADCKTKKHCKECIFHGCSNYGLSYEEITFLKKTGVRAVKYFKERI